MPCAATTRCSRPPTASNGFGRFPPTCWRRRFRFVSMSPDRGDPTPSTSSSPPAPGGCPSSELGDNRTAPPADLAGPSIHFRHQHFRRYSLPRVVFVMLALRQYDRRLRRLRRLLVVKLLEQMIDAVE